MIAPNVKPSVMSTSVQFLPRALRAGATKRIADLEREAATDPVHLNLG